MKLGRVIAIVGAESTGKTTLARELAARLAAQGHDTVVVAEHLREWCDAHARTPRADEQAAIAGEQTARIEAAAAAHALVVADTTALQTAVYSELLFADRSLYERALAAQQRCACTLLTALDLAWQPDGHQRDGEHVRAPVDALLRAALQRACIAYAVVHGKGAARVEAALAAVAKALPAPARGLFSRLDEAADAPAPRWVCELCDDPNCEHAARRRAG